ncbi:hypothetical protein JTE90_024729 [Oedothorax gibbosus]|uniref:Uncharacterized protein n=1 Tax=Oedothorax gibbosus TaxID=931172 RepID=A0AAV6UAF4_9ARAC|nr:hypothetical protein JTE90_024729 [Oedothorax gibbosus]
MHIIFKRERAKFRRALLVAERQSWSGYCRNAGKIGPWTVPDLIGAGKYRTPQVVGAVKDQNGCLTKNMANTMSLLMQSSLVMTLNTILMSTVHIEGLLTLLSTQVRIEMSPPVRSRAL